ncbi:hypothetical protein [Streptomyces sp. NPDC090025]|uniref:hypothetical protein n=1 Tax=Streptomyces sp. NPDC090025 TaxID=3365922 RepID=UPI003837C289
MTATMAKPLVYRMDRHPDAEVTMTAQCLAGACTWEAQPTADPVQSTVECEAHTADSGHDTFTVALEYIALVTVNEVPGEDHSSGRDHCKLHGSRRPDRGHRTVNGRHLAWNGAQFGVAFLAGFLPAVLR